MEAPTPGHQRRDPEAGFAIADHFMAKSARPQVWIAAAWGLTPLIIGVGVAATGGVDSPAVYWFAAPAVTLGARFESRGIALGSSGKLPPLREARAK